MSVPKSVAEILDAHTTLEVECIDRMYLNLYIPILQREAGIAHFWRKHRGSRFPSGAQMGPMSAAFVRSIERFAQQEGVPLIRFRPGERKDEVARRYLEKFPLEQGILFIGKAQEKTRVVRTEKRRNPQTGQSYPWLVMSTAMVNQYYFYCVDRDFGPFFIKIGSYFPYNGKLLLNGHEYAKRQLAQQRIGYEPLDNGIRSCEDPGRLQRICDGLSARKIDALARKWLRRLPHPFTPEDRRAGYTYELSILQAEFSLTQVLDRPLYGRLFFEQVIRDNLDLGRPDQVQLIFARRIHRRTPGRFRTRVITQGVIPSLHIDYKHTRIKQYYKEGLALRTETTINDSYDFEVGRRLQNLSALRKVGFQANRRLLRVQRISHDVPLGENVLSELQAPARLQGQRASGLRFGDPRVLALLSALLLFRLLPRGFSNRDLREQLAPLLGRDLDHLSQGQMTYDLRRLRLRGLIERIPRSHRYHVTDTGFRIALFLTRAHARLVRPGLAAALDSRPPAPTPLAAALARLDQAVDRIWTQGIAA
jgi:hypothetical protein